MNTTQSKVVICEDEVALAEIYQTLLTASGFTVFVAHDGEEGIALIKKELPDLVLLDLMMPKLSGDMVLFEMRADINTKDTKVIMLTNISETEAPQNLDSLNFSRYIVKANIQAEQLPDICNEVLAESSNDNADLKAL